MCIRDRAHPLRRRNLFAHEVKVRGHATDPPRAGSLGIALVIHAQLHVILSPGPKAHREF
eukprot:1509143-Pyramimonas_sp.AAC.1